MQLIFTPASKRARRARLAKFYANKWAYVGYKIIGLSGLFFGFYLLYIDQPSGWLVLIPGVIGGILYAWTKGDLKNESVIPIRAQELISTDDYMDFATIAKLTQNDPSAYDIYKALEKSEAHYFLQNRFLLPTEIFEEFAPKNKGSGQAVWLYAEQLRSSYELEKYSDITLLVAVLLSIPNVDLMLNNFGLDLKEMESAVPWLSDIHQKRALAKEHKFFGGIGRDWAFGYTPLLRAFGHNISAEIERYGFFSDTSHQLPMIEQMAKTLAGGNGTVTLVGESGVGKTTCVHAFADALLENPKMPSEIKHRQVVALDAPMLIANAKDPGQMEELVLRILNEAHKAKNIILFFDDAEVFFGIGSSIDLSHVLQPAIESSSLQLILAMNPGAWQQLHKSSVIGKLQPLTVSAPDKTNSIQVLRDSISVAEYKNKVLFTYQALEEAYDLGLRYVTNQAMPGAALTILEQAAVTGKEQKLITKEVVRQTVEQIYSIKLQASDQAESTELLNLEAELHKYVINQDRAVEVVSDALRRARSGVSNPNRPIGTFLFLGPTGVGKTELSKALAKVYFGSESSLVRVDMNQYVNESDLSRLLAPMHGNELGFLGQVRKTPFCVVLLDEIEKAHQSVINSFLQMLDEGMMQDSDNHNVSFRDAIVIATSNAGAGKIREFISNDEEAELTENAFVEELISSGAFAPEFINRFDEVVIFKPLDKDELTSVIDLILKDINKNLDDRKIQITLTPAAKQWLSEKGYDPKLGARPMRRMVQRHVENVVAKRLLEQTLHPGQAITLDVGDIEKSN